MVNGTVLRLNKINLARGASFSRVAQLCLYLAVTLLVLSLFGATNASAAHVKVIECEDRQEESEKQVAGVATSLIASSVGSSPPDPTDHDEAHAPLLGASIDTHFSLVIDVSTSDWWHTDERRAARVLHSGTGPRGPPTV